MADDNAPDQPQETPDEKAGAAQPEAHERSPEVNFSAFVVSLAHTAAIHFGDVPDPSTGQKTDPNQAAARQMIDILSLLEEKTRGNLTPEERQLLDQLLYELRMRYVEGQKPKSPIITP